MRKGRTKRAPVAKKTARRRSSGTGARVSLSLQERQVLKEACRRYQYDLPSYLKTARSEHDVLKDILRKL